MHSAGCGEESASTTADAGKKFGEPVDAAQVAADCKEPQACEKAVEFHNLVLEGSYLNAFDLIYCDPENSVAMERQQRIGDTRTDTLDDFYKINEAQVQGQGFDG